MNTYDEIPEFVEYHKKESWNQYTEESLKPLYRNSEKILDCHRYLEKTLDGQKLSSLDEQERKMFLGGINIDDDKRYRSGSVAKLYKKFLGAGINVDEWRTDQKNNLGIHHEITVQDTDENEFIELTEEIRNRARRAVENSEFGELKSLNQNKDVKKTVENPKEVKDLITNFYTNLLDFTINQNYGTFFIWSLNHSPKIILKQAYNDFQDNEDLYQKEFRLTRLEWEDPIQKEKGPHNYEILSYPEYDDNKDQLSFGGSVCKANEKIWNYFDKKDNRELFKNYFSPVENLKENYLKDSKSNIVNLPDKLVDQNKQKIKIEDDFGGKIKGFEELADNLPECIAKISPLLFLGTHKMNDTYSNNFRIEAR